MCNRELSSRTIQEHIMRKVQGAAAAECYNALDSVEQVVRELLAARRRPCIACCSVEKSRRKRIREVCMSTLWSVIPLACSCLLPKHPTQDLKVTSASISCFPCCLRELCCTCSSKLGTICLLVQQSAKSSLVCNVNICASLNVIESVPHLWLCYHTPTCLLLTTLIASQGII